MNEEQLTMFDEEAILERIMQFTDINIIDE